jgi:hypothetical protein
MPDVTGNTERGDIETRFSEALGKRKGSAASTSANPSSFVVAGGRFGLSVNIPSLEFRFTVTG